MEKINKVDLKQFFGEKKINVCISSASFEKRCFALADSINAYKVDHSIVCRIIDFDTKVVEMSNLLSDKITSKEKTTIDLKIGDPAFSYLELTRSISPIFTGQSKSVAIDITTFTHECLLIVVKILYNLKRSIDQLFFCYNGAKEYSCNEKERNDKWLTKGIKEVRSIIGYPGYSDPSLKNHLIVLFGFERERTMRLIEEFDYNQVSLAFGEKSQSIHSDHQEINEERHSEILKLLSNSKKFNISLTDPSITEKQILDYVTKFDGCNIVLAPMNNKLSTIGAGLAAIENPNIQLCYLQANRYNIEGYSSAGDDFYIWSME